MITMLGINDIYLKCSVLLPYDILLMKNKKNYYLFQGYTHVATVTVWEVMQFEPWWRSTYLLCRVEDEFKRGGNVTCL